MLVALERHDGCRRRTGRAPHRRRGDRGSVLMLMPAAVLVMIILASIGADLSHVHMARAGLSDLAQTIANDVAAGALDTSALRTTGSYQINGSRASAIAEDRIRYQGTRSLEDLQVLAITPGTAGGAMTVTVTLTARVEHIFGKAIPGVGDAMPLIATSTAALREGP